MAARFPFSLTSGGWRLPEVVWGRVGAAMLISVTFVELPVKNDAC